MKMLITLEPHGQMGHNSKFGDNFDLMGQQHMKFQDSTMPLLRDVMLGYKK